MSKLLDALRSLYESPDDAIAALGLDPKLLAMDAANPDPTGKLNEKQQAVASKTPDQREDLPADVFLLPAERKYPVKTKQDGKWTYSRNLLLAAARRARLNGDESLAKRADENRAREFGSTAQDGDIEMPKSTSRRAITARGAILAFLQPKLAQDAKFDPGAILAEVNAKNFKAKIPAILAGVKTGTAGKLAHDADPQDLQALLESLGNEDGTDDETNAANPGMMDNQAGVVSLDDENHPVHGFLAQKLSPEDHMKAKELMGDDKRGMDAARTARDAMWKTRAEDARKRLGRDESDEEMDKREEDEAAQDARKKMGRDEAPEEKDKREKEDAEDRKRRRADDAKRKADDKAAAAGAKDAPTDFQAMPKVNGAPMVTKQAMDEAIGSATKTAIDTERTNQRAIQTALREVRAYVGDLDIAFDSADGVYKKALEMRNTPDLDAIHPSAYRAVLKAQPLPGAKEPKVTVAMDAKGEKSFFEMYPGAKNIRTQAM